MRSHAGKIKEKNIRLLWKPIANGLKCYVFTPDSGVPEKSIDKINCYRDLALKNAQQTLTRKAAAKVLMAVYEPKWL